jgi:hypothetical protein
LQNIPNVFVATGHNGLAAARPAGLAISSG